MADKIGASNDQLLDDIGRFFSVEYSSLWNVDTGEDQIRRLIVEYTYVKVTNSVLHTAVHSRKDANKEWSEKLKYVMCSCEALQNEYPNLKDTFGFLKQIYLDSKILPEQMKSYTKEFACNAINLERYFENEIPTFARIYMPYLESLTDEDLSQLKTPELAGVFEKSRTESNTIVKKIADEFRKNQTKTQLFKLWKDKTGFKSPAAWSSSNRTPILAVVPKKEYDDAKKTFDVLNCGTASKAELQDALEFLGKAKLFDCLNSKEKVDEAFRNVLGKYKEILSDIDKVRDDLEKLPIEPYDWGSHPRIKDKIECLAKIEYDAGGSDKAIAKINSMNSDELKEHLILRIKDDMSLGIEILGGDEESL